MERGFRSEILIQYHLHEEIRFWQYVFHRLGYMERQGSGLNKITSAYKKCDKLSRRIGTKIFFSHRVEFTVTLQKFGLSRSKVQRRTKKLIDKGFIVREGSRRKGK